MSIEACKSPINKNNNHLHNYEWEFKEKAGMKTDSQRCAKLTEKNLTLMKSYYRGCILSLSYQESEQIYVHLRLEMARMCLKEVIRTIHQIPTAGPTRLLSASLSQSLKEAFVALGQY